MSEKKVKNQKNESGYAFLSGNEACVRGALMAGLNFFAGYPITPSTEIAEELSGEMPKLGRQFIQMEDEIASMGAIIGASLAGAKSMTATSGPGFSLMQENLGYAAIAEVPCVVVNVQRLGPSTGGPTSPAQQEVMQARWGTHGDHPIIALAPSSVQETLELTITSFYFSEKYRTPVILLLDESIGHMRAKVKLPDPECLKDVDRKAPTCAPDEYFPYDYFKDVPRLASFGEGYRYNVTGLHHDEEGFPTQRFDEINAWYSRAFGKIEKHRDEIELYELINMDDAEIAVISFGVSALSSMAAIKIARKMGIKVGLVKLKTIWPFPEKLIWDLSEKVKQFIIPELNMGQLIYEVQRINQGRACTVGVNRADGDILHPLQIVDVMLN